MHETPQSSTRESLPAGHWMTGWLDDWMIGIVIGRYSFPRLWFIIALNELTQNDGTTSLEGKLQCSQVTTSTKRTQKKDFSVFSRFPAKGGLRLASLSFPWGAVTLLCNVQVLTKNLPQYAVQYSTKKYSQFSAVHIREDWCSCALMLSVLGVAFKTL